MNSKYRQTKQWEAAPLAFWLAPLVATFPLVPLFSLRISPLFLGTLMADSTHPTNAAWFGPWLSALAVVFNGTMLGYSVTLVAGLPVYLLLRRAGHLSVKGSVVMFVLLGIFASQLVGALEHFSQPGLHAFAHSWFSPFFGAACGLVGGVFFVVCANRRSGEAHPFFYLLPVFVLSFSAIVQVWEARIWIAR